MSDGTVFLSTHHLSRKIREVSEGENVKCAVAYWGSQGLEFNSKSVSIICDIESGFTSPDFLKRMRAPNNDQIRYYNGLHSKVYISNKGLIVGSANASQSALGSKNEDEKLLEAGIYHEPGTEIWKQATEWFDELFNKSNIVDKNALSQSEINFKKRQIQNSKEYVTENSFLDYILKNENILSKKGIVFVVTKGRASDKATQQAINEIRSKLHNKNETINLEKWHEDYTFIEFTKNEVFSINEYFIEICLDIENANKYIIPHKKEYIYAFDDERSHFLSSNKCSSFVKETKIDKLNQSKEIHSIIRKKLVKVKTGVYTPSQIAKYLNSIKVE